MKVGIPFWVGRVSPVFDVARNLIIVELVDGRETHRAELTLMGKSLPERAIFIKENGVHCVLCGAVSNDFLQFLQLNGIQVVPWLSGSVEEILSAFINGSLNEPRYIMPGCCGRRRRRRRGFGKRRLDI